MAGPLCPVVSLRLQGRARRTGTVWRTRRMICLVSDARIGPCALPIETTPLEGEGDVVKKPKARLDAWAEAQKRFHLSDLPIQMARELGLNPKKFGGLANHRQEPWKLPLPEFIVECYLKRFHRERPAKVVPLAEVATRQQPSARDTARHPPARTDT